MAYCTTRIFLHSVLCSSPVKTTSFYSCSPGCYMETPILRRINCGSFIKWNLSSLFLWNRKDMLSPFYFKRKMHSTCILHSILKFSLYGLSFARQRISLFQNTLLKKKEGERFKIFLLDLYQF